MEGRKWGRREGRGREEGTGVGKEGEGRNEGQEGGDGTGAGRGGEGRRWRYHQEIPEIPSGVTIRAQSIT
jgi:hypothetical protein